MLRDFGRFFAAMLGFYDDTPEDAAPVKAPRKRRKAPTRKRATAKKTARKPVAKRQKAR